MNFYQEIALSHTDALVAKINILSFKNIPSFLKEICKKILFSDEKIPGVIDDKDLKNYRFFIAHITDILDIFSKTNPDISSSGLNLSFMNAIDHILINHGKHADLNKNPSSLMIFANCLQKKAFIKKSS